MMAECVLYQHIQGFKEIGFQGVGGTKIEGGQPCIETVLYVKIIVHLGGGGGGELPSLPAPPKR